MSSRQVRSGSTGVSPAFVRPEPVEGRSGQPRASLTWCIMLSGIEQGVPMTTETKLVTAEELIALPDDCHRYELVRGELIQMAPPGLSHGRFAGCFIHSLWSHVEARSLGQVYPETGYRLSSNPDTVRAPDASFISRDRLAEVGETDGYWPGAPDLAVEVISPNDRYTDVEAKVSEWLDAGTRMVIVVNPRRRSVRVHRSPTEVDDLVEGDAIEGGDVVPGWSMPISGLF